jgi:hypothetical protein
MNKKNAVKDTFVFNLFTNQGEDLESLAYHLGVRSLQREKTGKRVNRKWIKSEQKVKNLSFRHCHIFDKQAILISQQSNQNSRKEIFSLYKKYNDK